MNCVLILALDEARWDKKASCQIASYETEQKKSYLKLELSLKVMNTPPAPTAFCRGLLLVTEYQLERPARRSIKANGRERLQTFANSPSNFDCWRRTFATSRKWILRWYAS